MTGAGRARYAKVAAALLATIIVLNGCAKNALVILDQNPSADLAKDQAECATEAKASAEQAGAVGRGVSTTLTASIAGAIGGAGLGALLGVWIAANASSQDPKETGLIIAAGAGAGAVIGWFVGTGFGIRASAREAQDLVDQAFERCMKQRGYKIGRDRL
jgi:hypothetical protein